MVNVLYDRLLEFMKNDGEAHVWFIPDIDGVVVPPHLRDMPQVLFHIGINLPTPIFDLEIREDMMSGTLTFGGYGPFFCVVPMAAVFRVTAVPPRIVQNVLERKPSKVVYLDDYRKKRRQ